MSSHRVSDWADVRALHKQQLKDAPRSGDPKTAAPPELSGAGNAEIVAETGIIELDPAEIAAADAELARREDELSGYLEQAKLLAHPLKDGTSPVAAHLRKAFGIRGSADGGVQAILRQYLDELAGLRTAIRQAGTGHVQQDSDAKDALDALHRKAADAGGTQA